MFGVKVFKAPGFQGVCGQGVYGSGHGASEAIWPLQFDCEMAILGPNLDLGLLKPSGNHKEVFRVKVFGVKVFKVPGFQGVCGQGVYGSGHGASETIWQLQFDCERAILGPNLDLGLLKPSGNHKEVFKVKVFGVKVFKKTAILASNWLKMHVFESSLPNNTRHKASSVHVLLARLERAKATPSPGLD